MDELRKLIGVLKPATVRRLAEMGIFDPRRVVAGAAALPWVIGRGASLGSLCQIQATSRPGRTAIVDRHGALTWWELDGRVNALAHAYASLGVEPGDQVALLLRNGRELCESLLAAGKTGVVAAPLNTWARSRELGAILDRARPALCVYDTRHAPQLDGVVPEGVRLVHVGPDDAALAGSLAYTDVLGTESSLPPSPMARDRGSNTVLIHTSGTTGTPKAAARSAGTAGAAALLGLLDAIPYRHDDVMYIPNPLFHALGLGVFGVGMGTGATMVLPDAFDPRRALEDMARHRATVASFVPVMLRRILDLDDPPDLDLSALRVVLVSGSALPRDLRRRAIDRFGEVLYDMYGSTEAGWIAIATPETMRIAPDSVGKPVAGVEVAILDATGDPVTGGKGEVHVRSGALFDGYASGEDSAERGGSCRPATSGTSMPTATSTWSAVPTTWSWSEGRTSTPRRSRRSSRRLTVSPTSRSSAPMTRRWARSSSRSSRARRRPRRSGRPASRTSPPTRSLDASSGSTRCRAPLRGRSCAVRCRPGAVTGSGDRGRSAADRLVRSVSSRPGGRPSARAQAGVAVERAPCRCLR
jgi:acyl-CoA synthetase (AMP-forming)/AMP-acid ligase II